LPPGAPGRGGFRRGLRRSPLGHLRRGREPPSRAEGHPRDVDGREDEVTLRGARLAAVAAALAAAAWGCGRRSGGGRVERIEGSTRAVISLAKVDGLSAPSEKSGSSTRLPR